MKTRKLLRSTDSSYSVMVKKCYVVGLMIAIFAGIIPARGQSSRNISTAQLEKIVFDVAKSFSSKYCKDFISIAEYENIVIRKGIASYSSHMVFSDLLTFRKIRSRIFTMTLTSDHSGSSGHSTLCFILRKRRDMNLNSRKHHLH